MTPIRMTAPAVKKPKTHVFVLAAFVGIGLLFMLIAARTDQQGRSTGSLLLATFACVGMFMFAASRANNLVKARKTLENLRAPATAWTPFLRNCLRETSVTWLVLAGTLTLQLALRPGSKPHWLSAGALVSLAACLGMLQSLAQSELMPRLRGMIHPAAAFIVSVPLVLGSPIVLDTEFAAKPGIALATAVLCWPALAAGLLLRWRGPPVLRAAGRDDGNARLLDWLARLRRYSLLKRGVAIIDDRKFDWHSIAASGSCVFLLDLMASTGTGGALTINHLLGMIALVYQAYHLLSVRDLHWRTFVAPGGMRQRDIAMNIFCSTLRTTGPLVLFMFALLPAMDLLLGFRSFDAAMQGVWRHALLLAELPLIIAAAVLLKALPQPYAGWCAVAAWTAAYALANFTGVATQPLGSMKADFSYLLLLAATTALLLLAARRLWTPRRMLSYLKLR